MMMEPFILLVFFTRFFTQTYIFNPILNPVVKALFGRGCFSTFAMYTKREKAGFQNGLTNNVKQ